MMSQLELAFRERAAEVDEYLIFLTNLETAAQLGVPKFHITEKSISPRQSQMLRASVFVQLYNLVESTMVRCLEALAAASFDGAWKAADLNPDFRKEWIKVTMAINKEMNSESRLNYAVSLVDMLVNNEPITSFKFERGGGGNWSDRNIEDMLQRVGLRLRLSRAVRAAAKRKFRDDLGPLALVVKLRNDLAHGNISFSECGENETISGLRQICEDTKIYLLAIVRAVVLFVEQREFLHASRRAAIPA